jgi:hypothetical protein
VVGDQRVGVVGGDGRKEILAIFGYDFVFSHDGLEGKEKNISDGEDVAIRAMPPSSA